MFLRQALDDQVVIRPLTLCDGDAADDRAVTADRREPPRRIRRQGLAAAVEDDAVGRRGADDRGEDGEGASVQGGGAESNLRAIEVDVVARPVFRDPILGE
jgi:hypothetical protein